MTPHVADFIRQLHPVDTRAHGGLQAVRLARPEVDSAGVPPLPMSPLTAAVSCGVATVSEVGSGDVGHLRIHNRTGALLFGMAGELVVGGRQDRVLNSSVLIAPGAAAAVAVSCVEQHRWDGGARRDFTPARATASSAVRSTVHRTMITNLQTSGRHRTDQHQVWREVDSTLRRTGTFRATATGALTSGLAHQGDRLDAYARACALPCHTPAAPQLGLALFTPGTPSAGLHGFTSLDGFASPDLLNHYASRLVRGAALEALADNAPSPMVAPPDATAHLLAALADQQPVVSRPAAGDAPGAQELHYAFDGIVASVLCHQGQPVHLAVSPLDEPHTDSPSRPDNRCQLHLPAARVDPPPAPRPPLPDTHTLCNQHHLTLVRIQTPDAAPRFLRLPPGAYTIGRADENHIQLDDPEVSRTHARLDLNPDGGGVVRDLGSTNGIIHNNEPVLFANLERGDCISIGRNAQIWLLRTV